MSIVLKGTAAEIVKALEDLIIKYGGETKLSDLECSTTLDQIK